MHLPRGGEGPGWHTCAREEGEGEEEVEELARMVRFFGGLSPAPAVLQPTS